ncbi:MAG: GrpB family protein [Chloroflexota bacterium]
MDKMHPSQIPVKLEPYNPDWVLRFQAARDEIMKHLGHVFDDVQHFGSTSIDGMVAKPTIDMLAGTWQFPWDEGHDQHLEKIGFKFYKANHDRWRVYLKPHQDKVRGYHLHVVEYGSEHWLNHLLFRDYLRQHPEDAAEYAFVKLRLAQSESVRTGGRGAYQLGKKDVVQKIMQKAVRWREEAL